MPGLRMREAREPSAITIPIIVQDPRRTPNPVNVSVRGPLLAGPIGERMAVFDYNNTSIVMPLTHGSARLLLVGDAEEMSWEIMRTNGAPLNAEVIKVGHHGSINASPDWSFTMVMPKKLARNAAVISTDADRFTGENEVPNDTVLKGWRARLKSPSRLLRTDSKSLGESVAVTLEG